MGTVGPAWAVAMLRGPTCGYSSQVFPGCVTRDEHWDYSGFCGVYILVCCFFFSPRSFWSTWLIPIFGALVLGLMYRYYMVDGKSS